MGKRIITLGTGILTVLGSLSATADSIQWSGNGHSYQAFLVDSISWADANAAAVAKGGYLATLTSAEENQWVYDNIVAPIFGTGPNVSDQAWLGGLKPVGSSQPSEGWQWVSGETWTYANWGSGEPNNVGGIENHLTINRFGDWSWNDEGSWPSGVKGYVVEYVPDGGMTLVMLGLGIGCVSIMARIKD